MFCYTTISGDRLEAVRENGLESARIYSTLDEAQRAPGKKVLVLDSRAIEPSGRIPVDAILNIDPFLPPAEVTAAGGLLIRLGPELLMIYRKGHWDLPKGKQNAGESIEDCARREICEELGIDEVTLVRPAGTTRHAYAEPQKNRYAIKTTYWYLARTNATKFEPEREEGIDRVEWVPLAEAPVRADYTTLRELIRSAIPLITAPGMV